MDSDLKQLERDVERRLDAMGGVFDAAPPDDSIERLKSAVDDEALRIRRRQSLTPYVRSSAGAAAAILIALGMTLPRSSQPQGQFFVLDENPDQAFSAWVDALDESGAQFTRLLDDDWMLEFHGDLDDDIDTESGPLDSLNESFESLERVIGA